MADHIDKIGGSDAAGVVNVIMFRGLIRVTDVLKAVWLQHHIAFPH
jgi:hypothetical protein